MRVTKPQKKNDQGVCSVEQAINDANWDRDSSWAALTDKCEIAAWKEEEEAEKAVKK